MVVFKRTCFVKLFSMIHLELEVEDLTGGDGGGG